MSDDITLNPYDRPSARFTDRLSPTRSGNGKLEVRASALGQCRRRLWYAATDQPVSNPTTPETQLIFDAGNALEPVVIRAMQRAGWTISPTNREGPTAVSVELDDHLVVTGHPDATGSPPASAASVEDFLFDPEDLVIEVKTRGPEAFKRWQTLGAERSHPDSVAQAASYSLGLFGEVRDVVIATLDTGSRRWDYEVIPANRVERAWNQAGNRLTELAEHFAVNGPDPSVLPDRDFEASDWQCRSCPYLNVCQPGEAAGPAVADSEDDVVEPVLDEAARGALRDYEQAQSELKSLDAVKRGALKTLQHWLHGTGQQKAKLQGSAKTRTVGMVASRRYAVDHKRLNALLDPETRAEVVTEQTSEYLRVS